MDGVPIGWKKLMNLLMQLRKVCDHPYLLEDASPSPYAIGEHIIASSSKLVVIDKILSDILPKDERVLIFSQWTNMLDVLEDFMELRGIPYARLDGSTTRPRHTLDIKLRNRLTKSFWSIKAGGLGINLTKASTVIMYENRQGESITTPFGSLWAYPTTRCIDRFVEEDQMLDRIRRKLFLSIKVMSSNDPASDGKESENAQQLKKAELMDILRKGSSTISGEETGMDFGRFSNAPIDAILEESRAREGDAEEEERRLLSGVAQVQSQLFEGQVVNRPQNNEQIAQEWNDLRKCARTTIGLLWWVAYTSWQITWDAMRDGLPKRAFLAHERGQKASKEALESQI
ncbi:hypothetical protein OG21DRAFT_1502152 [Imleria badia]|nr:hypothetical protein OG21DRAFT_1502152 [Imleria badia]